MPQWQQRSKRHCDTQSRSPDQQQFIRSKEFVFAQKSSLEEPVRLADWMEIQKKMQIFEGNKTLLVKDREFYIMYVYRFGSLRHLCTRKNHFGLHTPQVHRPQAS